MTDTPENEDAVTVAVTLRCAAADQDRLAGLAQDSLPVFTQQPGFISAALHKSTDGTRVMNVLTWRSEADHLACMQNGDVAAAGAAFMAFAEEKNVEMDVAVYCAVTPTASG